VEFEVMQSHCGQIEWPPQGWSLIATAGRGSKTKTQCLRMDGHYIYAAQFHIEMKGTSQASQQIMANFLALSKSAQVK
jgi:GMP synthase-like glutamine amidotransferase